MGRVVYTIITHNSSSGHSSSESLRTPGLSILLLLVLLLDRKVRRRDMSLKRKQLQTGSLHLPYLKDSAGHEISVCVGL